MPWSTLLFRRLAQNTTFRHVFVNRFADELNSRFLPERVIDHIDDLSDAIAFDVNEHFDRLQFETMGNYWEQVTIVLQQSRSYNTSSTALYKRRQYKMES